ncbi:MAG: hypothetical protein L6R41_001091 [Letrouitia leprolyta]|nr:MAG: hypothetical protein L6R41_001091 [Letrouitia leprolyta]
MEHECQLILSCQSISHIDEALDREFASDVKSNIECGSEACKNTRVEKEYSKTLARAPDILCIQFNRFRVTNAGTKKNTRQIGFDEELDLSRFTKRHASLRYRLMAVVHHRGSWEFGHYISMTRRDRDCWYRQDDESVKEVGLNDVLEPMGEFTPYLLFWAKVRPRKEIPNAPSPKERPCGEMSVPRLDEIGQSPSKISSKKRSREEAQTATERETERPPLKSAKTSNVLANDTHISPRPESISRSRWPSRWLWGGLEISDKTQQAEKKLLEWQKEHERKDELIEQQKGLIRRAAVTHAQLVVSLALLNASYEESRQATDIIHPIIRNIHARGKEKYGNKAGKLLQLAKSARDRLRGGSYAFNVSERIARLVEPLTAEDAENEELPAFIAAVNEARSEDRLEAWLDEELTTSGLPIGA